MDEKVLTSKGMNPAASREDAPRDYTRDHLANERTFLAWVRTALGLLGFGFVIARMGFFLWQLGPDVPEVPDARASGIEYLGTGLVFVLLGTGLVSWAGFHYLRTLDSIERGRFDPARRSIITIAIVVAMAGCVIAGLVIMGSLMRTGNRS